ncbi:MAG: HlyC/CorC family transporter [Dehalococcoidales bacterium]|nr:MAG: HlyC/CorC family transporter [Dehalococcoidales bacterium]
MSTVETLYLVFLFTCLVFSAFFSSSETAFISQQRIRLEHLINTKVKGAERVAGLIQKPERLLSIVLLGNNLVNTAATALATALAIRFWPEHGVLITTIGLTIILLIFSETIPKTVAAQHTERVTLFYARPLQVISWLLTPFVLLLSWIATGISRILGTKPVPRLLVSEGEIRTMISVSHREGEVEETEAEMLHNVFDFGDRPVSEVMLPRLEVIAIEQGSKIADFLTLYAESPLSRFTVYQENMDNVVGILAIKDVLMAEAKGAINDDSIIDGLIRPAYFAPESKRISELFAEMRDENYRMAVVVDEYGGTAGIVSLTQLVEEIVGPVGDELAAVEKDYEVINEYTFQIDGGMRIEEVNEEMNLELPEGDYETVAGFVLSLLGHIPKVNEQVRYQDLKLVVTEMRGVKIETILLTKEGIQRPQVRLPEG